MVFVPTFYHTDVSVLGYKLTCAFLKGPTPTQYFSIISWISSHILYLTTAACNVYLFILSEHQWNTKPFHFKLFVARGTILCNHSNSDLFTGKDNISCEKISCFHTKGHLAYHCLTWLICLPVNKRDQLKLSLHVLESRELQV